MSVQSPLYSITAAPQGPEVTLETAIEDPGVPRRQCGRCRLLFPGDPDLFPGTIPDWRLCPPCRAALLGAEAERNPR